MKKEFKVLLIDDEGRILKVIGKSLEDEGFKVINANSKMKRTVDKQ